MSEKQKPRPPIVSTAARALHNPKTVSLQDIKDMAGRILTDQRNDPQPHKPQSPKKK
jgi:hypothetical protein